MFKSRWNIVLAFAACALLLPATVSAKKQVTRPFTIRGDVTVTFVPYYASATGVATHIGQYSSESTPSIEFPSRATLTAANGDQLYWDENCYDLIWTATTLTFTMECTIDGGTGRFEGASGSFGPVTVTADLTPTGCTFSYSASGTITY